MPFDPEAFQIEDALATSQAVYEVQFPDWGVRTTPVGFDAVNPNFQFPPPGIRAVPSTLAAIAIGPRSTVERVWVAWDRQKITIATSGTPENPGMSTESKVRPLSIDHPLLFPQASRNGILPSTEALDPLFFNANNNPQVAMHYGLLYVFPKEAGSASDEIYQNTTILPSQYADETGVLWNFGNTGAVFPDFRKPYLELYLYLQPPLFPPPTKRFPQILHAAANTHGLGAFEPVAQLPIYGRKHIGMTLRNADLGASSHDYRFGLVRNIAEFIGVLDPKTEAPAGTITGVANGHSANFQIDNPNADYLNVYCKSTIVGGRVRMDLDARD